MKILLCRVHFLVNNNVQISKYVDTYENILKLELHFSFSDGCYFPYMRYYEVWIVYVEAKTQDESFDACNSLNFTLIGILSR